MLMVTSLLALALVANHSHAPRYSPLFRPEVVSPEITRETALLADDRAHKGCLDSLEAQRESALHQAAKLAASRHWDSVLLSFNLGANYITENYVIIGANKNQQSIFIGPELDEISLSKEDYKKIAGILGRPAPRSAEESQDEACRVLVRVTRQGTQVFGSKTDIWGKDSSVISQFDAWLEPLLPE